MIRYRYYWLHFESQKRGESRSSPCVSRWEFLEMLDIWNQSSPGWKYWSVPGDTGQETDDETEC